MRSDRPITATLSALFNAARHTVLDSVMQFDAAALTRLRQDVTEIAGALRSAVNVRE